MTDTTKYRNVSLSNETYKSGHLLSTKMFKGLQVSISQVLEALISEKIKELNLNKDLEKYEEPTRRVFKKRKKKNGKLKK
tara:strand:- start:197 stop:436 length:240 start_codon:yes stop_codon:yes gene_type:complete